MTYLLARWNAGTIDTIHATQLFHDMIGSVIRLKYHFDYQLLSKQDYEEEFVLPTKVDSARIGVTNLVYQVDLEFEENVYPVYKYRFDVLNSYDEERLFFYTPKFGIILVYWGTFRNSQRLIDVGDIKGNRAVYFLTEMIESDRDLTGRGP